MNRGFINIYFLLSLLFIGTGNLAYGVGIDDQAMAAYDDLSFTSDADTGDAGVEDMSLENTDNTPTIIDSGFDVVSDTPIWVNITDGKADLMAAWGACTAMAQVVREYFTGKRTLPKGENLRLYSRVKADRKKSSRKTSTHHRGSKPRSHRTSSHPVSKKRPLALWEEILKRQSSDLFKNIGRSFSLSRKKAWKKYESIRDGVESAEPPLIVFKCSQKGAAFHGLVAYKIQETEKRAVIWVYDCNLIYTCDKSNMPSDWTMDDRLNHLAPLNLENASRDELTDFLSSKEGEIWRFLSVSDPSSTQIIFDKTTGRFSFSQKYRGLLNGLLVESYLKEPGDSDDLKIKVEK